MERKSSSSSSRRQNSVGCMSAIFNLLYKHNKRSKYISSGKEQRKEAANELKDAKLQTRSPSLPVEMRRSSENRPHGLVARLMGLEMFPPSPESSSCPDQKLKLQQLDELEKCDEDLKALQRIIEVVKTSISVGLGDNEELRRRRSLQQQQQQQQLTKKKAVEEYITATAKGACSFLDRFTTEPVAYAKSNKNDEENAVSDIWGFNVKAKAKAMKHSVDEVCKDMAWGEKREIGRISLALQHNICRDLIHELVSEIACYSPNSIACHLKKNYVPTTI